MYKLKDLAQEDIAGTFYDNELQCVQAPVSFRIEKNIERTNKKEIKGNICQVVKISRIQ